MTTGYFLLTAMKTTLTLILLAHINTVSQETISSRNCTSETISCSLSTGPVFCLEIGEITVSAKYKHGAWDTRANTQGAGPGESIVHAREEK